MIESSLFESLEPLYCVLRRPVNESTQIWYTARNLLLGLGSAPMKYDLRQGAALAEKSSHPDAIWITQILRKNGIDGCKEVLLSYDNSKLLRMLEPELMDSRALIYSHFLSPEANTRRDPNGFLKRAVEMKNGLALACGFNSTIHMLIDSALQDEPFGWRILSKLNPVATKLLDDGFVFKCLNRASAMNDTEAQLGMIIHFGTNNPEGWYWAGRLAAQGQINSKRKFFALELDAIREYENPSLKGVRTPGENLFLIGKILKSTIFSEYAFKYKDDFSWEISDDKTIKTQTISIKMYDCWCTLTRSAVDNWCLIAIRLTRLPKDVRLLISRFIWDSRGKALYNISTDGTLVVQSAKKQKR